MNIELHNIKNPPRVVEGRLELKTGKPAIIYHDQITEVDAGCTVEIPEGYIGLFEPASELIDISSVLCENNGIVSGAFSTLRLRKGTNGSVKLKTGDVIGYLTLVESISIEIKNVSGKK